MTSVVWTLDSEGSYLVESKEHLLMIMQRGSFTSNSVTYGADGSIPTSYYSGVDFRQTVNIDLENDSNCYAIGRSAGDAFTGSYDGAGYSVSNFVSASSGSYHGFFGYASNATLKDIVLKGTWDVAGISTTGNVCAAVCARTGGVSVIERIVVNGTVTCLTNCDTYGTLVGLIGGDTTVTDVTVRGLVSAVAVNYCGGVIGRVNTGTSSFKNLRYLATGDLEYTRPSINSGNGTNALGGVIGVIDSGAVANVQNLLNAMTGNLNALVNAGGVVGMCLVTDASKFVATNLVNAMTGNIAGAAVGGIYGRSYLGTTSHVLNVMKGDVSSTGASSSGANGVCGLYFNGTCIDAVLAMEGNTSGASLEGLSVASGTVTISWATSDFGMTVGGSVISEVGTIPADSSNWGIHPDFPDIPYLKMSATDTESNVTYVETPYPVISGNGSVYDSTYDYYSIGFGGVTSRVQVDLKNPGDVYSLFKFDTANLNAIEARGSSLSYVEAPYTSFYLRMFAYVAAISWYYPGTKYDLYSTITGSPAEIREDSVERNATTLDVVPGSEYTFEVYADESLAVTSSTETAPVASGSSISEMMEFLENDISGISTTAVAGVLEFISGVLATGDELWANVRLDNSLKTESLTYVNLNDTISIPGISHLLTPFVTSGGSSQTVTLELSDLTTEGVTYDDSADNITVRGNTYDTGSVFILDGRKVSVTKL